jgi:hypothetical protein
VFFSNGVVIPANSRDEPILFTRMFARTKQVTDLANRYGVVLYTFDPSGLVTPVATDRGVSMMAGLGTPVRAAGPQIGNLPGTQMQQRGDAASIHELPAFLARETGGVAVKNTNDLSKALGKAMEDMTGYYLIGYSPRRDERESSGAAKEHRIQIRMLRSGLNVRSRKGYTEAVDEISPTRPPTREEQLTAALMSPFAAGGIGLHLTTLYSASAPDTQTNKRQALLRVDLAAEGKDIEFTSSPDGRNQASLDIAVAVYDALDNIVTSQNKSFTLQVTADQAKRIAANGLPCQLDIPIPKPGAYQVRATVRDATSGEMGSATTFVMIPDFNRQQLTLSSLVLAAAGGGTEYLSSVRHFAAGNTLDYAFEVFGAQDGAEGPSVDVQIKLFHIGQQVYSSALMPLKSHAGAKDIPVTGKLNLPDAFAAGDYEMELIAYDRLAAARRQSVQWTDFSIVNNPH